MACSAGTWCGMLKIRFLFFNSSRFGPSASVGSPPSAAAASSERAAEAAAGAAEAAAVAFTWRYASIAKFSTTDLTRFFWRTVFCEGSVQVKFPVMVRWLRTVGVNEAGKFSQSYGLPTPPRLLFTQAASCNLANLALITGQIVSVKYEAKAAMIRDRKREAPERAQRNRGTETGGATRAKMATEHRTTSS